MALIGRPPRDWPIDELRRWIEDEKVSHKVAGKRLGCAHQTIGKLCKKHGIQTQRQGCRSGPGHHSWKGGRIVDCDGYVLIWTPDHPRARRGHRINPGGHVLEHRLVMEAHLGRYLTGKEVVHHLNDDKRDNRIENLELFASNADHLRATLKGKVPNWTEDGKARIRAGVRKAAAKRRQQTALDEQASP